MKQGRIRAVSVPPLISSGVSTRHFSIQYGFVFIHFREDDEVLADAALRAFLDEHACGFVVWKAKP